MLSGSSALVALVVCSLIADVAAQQPSIVGTWDWTRKANNCAEQYTFRNDGGVSIKSGAEQLERTYLMSWSPEPNGRYKLSMTTVKDSGGSGCADTPAGGTARQGTLYVLFGGSGETMLICNSPAEADCIGPLKRAR